MTNSSQLSTVNSQLKKGWEVKKLGEGWETKELGKVCEIFNGLWKGKKPPFIEVGVIRNTNFTKDGFLDDSDIAFLPVEVKKFVKRKLQYGDIILEKSGGGPKQPVGRVIPFDKKIGEFSFSNFTSVIRIKDSSQLNFIFLHRFLFWMYVSGITETMQRRSTGIRNLQLKEYKEIPIPIPFLPEQQRIVEILDKAFIAIDKAKQNAEQNLRNSKEVFENYLDAVFENEGGGWAETSLKKEIDLVTGFAFKSKKYTDNDDDILLLRGDNIMQGDFRWKDAKRWSKSEYSDFEKYQLQETDIVLAMDRPWVKAGLKCARVSKHELPSLLVQRTARLRNKPQLDNSFLYYLIQSKGFTDYLIDIQTGIGVPHISGKQIFGFHFRKPSLKKQKQIVQKLDALSAETKKLEKIYRIKTDSLMELKKATLKQAFEGEL